MKKIKYVLAGLVLAVAAGIAAVLGVQQSDRRLLSAPEEEVYAAVRGWSTERLIRRINRIEKKLPEMPDKTALLPLLSALCERADEFTADELIEQIQRRETLPGIEEAFVKMYAAGGYDSKAMLALLDDTELSEETKEYITSHCGFTADELSEIFRSTDGRTAVIAIQRISAENSEAAMQLVREFTESGDGSIPEEKAAALCLGIAQYYEEHREPEDIAAMKDIYIPMMKKLLQEAQSQRVRDQAVYALGRICDYELFAWLMENGSLDRSLKISVTERNYRPMKRWIEEAESEEDILAVTEAMEIYPILEIADALEKAIEQGTLEDTERLRSVIEHIREKGIPAVDKYDN